MSSLLSSVIQHPSASIGIGFGTAALGNACEAVVLMALHAGFRAFDTAEADWWYDQAAVGRALRSFFDSFSNTNVVVDDECIDIDGNVCGTTSKIARSCRSEDLRISTKIPPWSLTSADDIRQHAAESRQELVGFCDEYEGLDTMIVDDPILEDDDGSGTRTGRVNIGNSMKSQGAFTLDVYYIHAPTCWEGWHPRCDNHPPLLDLRAAWLAMEAVVGLDHSAQRIGLSNVHPTELMDIISFVQQRQAEYRHDTSIAPPRMPDVIQSFADPIEPAEDIRRLCQQYGIEFVSYSTLGTQHQYRGGNGGSNPVLDSPIIQQISIKHQRSTAEVVLSWALHHGMSVIPRSSKPAHIQQLARLLHQDPDFLDATDLTQIDTMKYSI